MRLTMRVLGLEVLHITTDSDQPTESRGDALSTPVGFTPWEDD